MPSAQVESRRVHPTAAAPDAVVVGSGPNGLAAAITLARAGRSVVVYEGAETVGGGMRSAGLTLPGYVHDVCSTVQGTSVASPFFAGMDLARHGVELVHPGVPLAHPFDDGRAALLERSVEATAAGLGADGPAYARLFGPLVRDADQILPFILGPSLRVPRHPLAVARFGLPALWPAATLARRRFRADPAQALFGGLCAHSMLALDRVASASFGLVLAMTAHAFGWPVVRGGTQRLADALAAELLALGGEIVTGHPVTTLDDVPAARAILFDTTPRALVAIAGTRLHGRYRGRLAGFRYGPGVVKVDWALDGPIPWRAEGVSRGGTVHVGGTLAEIAAAEAEVARGGHPDRPFVIVVQASRFDGSRAPEGKHTGWAYCHVPSGSTLDMSGRIEAQIERFAPGFRDLILARSVRLPADLEHENPNYIGGDINAGIEDVRQLFTRPVARLDPYSTPARGIYLCSSSTPPGGGVHGMCGVWAARSALRREFGG
ncbi:MAG TPA: NAD(P)/FAD-dependent oxidoreductase [Candidatus Acidoferrum sp.]|nr:NAD(P)/FAD-dependent oxidoreductase [Candidatus Acidoferrum sp.]